LSASVRVLRVLNGRLAGTEKQLPDAGTLSIGHQFWQDVVIRDPATKGVAVDLTLGAENSAQLTVLSGEAQLLGSALAEGGTALLPPYVPFTIGGVALAWGEQESERWSEASGLAVSLPAPAIAPPTAREHANAVLGRVRTDVGAAVTPRWLLAAGVLAVVALLVVFAVPIIDALGLRPPPARRVEAALTEAGLKGLVASPATDGSEGVVVRGVVRNPAERERAVRALRDSWVPGSVDVRTSAELAQATVEAARLRGVASVARPVGRTAVLLRTVPLEDDQAQRLHQSIRADVRDLTLLTLRDDLPPPEEARLKTVADATKKVSTVVSGDPSYIQTVDGARYFAGAMMPSGHRLVGIQGNVVVFEKGGRETRLTF